jgi:hypothetical protein
MIPLQKEKEAETRQRSPAGRKRKKEKKRHSKSGRKKRKRGEKDHHSSPNSDRTFNEGPPNVEGLPNIIGGEDTYLILI